MLSIWSGPNFVVWEWVKAVTDIKIDIVRIKKLFCLPTFCPSPMMFSRVHFLLAVKTQDLV